MGNNVVPMVTGMARAALGAAAVAACGALAASAAFDRWLARPEASDGEPWWSVAKAALTIAAFASLVLATALVALVRRGVAGPGRGLVFSGFSLAGLVLLVAALALLWSLGIWGNWAGPVVLVLPTVFEYLMYGGLFWAALSKYAEVRRRRGPTPR